MKLSKKDGSNNRLNIFHLICHCKCISWLSHFVFTYCFCLTIGCCLLCMQVSINRSLAFSLLCSRAHWLRPNNHFQSSYLYCYCYYFCCCVNRRSNQMKSSAPFLSFSPLFPSSSELQPKTAAIKIGKKIYRKKAEKKKTMKQSQTKTYKAK